MPQEPQGRKSFLPMSPHQILILRQFLGRFPLCLNPRLRSLHGSCSRVPHLQCSFPYRIGSVVAPWGGSCPSAPHGSLCDLPSMPSARRAPPTCHLAVAWILVSLSSQAVKWDSGGRSSSTGFCRVSDASRTRQPIVEHGCSRSLLWSEESKS